MIRKLKGRLILLVLAGLLLASAGVVIAINVMNWRALESQADAVLDMLAENGGRRPGSLGSDGNEAASGQPETFPDDDRDGWNQTKKAFMGRQRNESLVNAANQTNFFTAKLSPDGELLSWSSDRTNLYADEDVAQTVRDALALGVSSGRVGTMFFRLTGDGSLFIAVDQQMEIQNAKSVLRLTVLVALIEDALLSLGAVWLIRRMVKPVDEAMEKQKQFVWDASHELKTPLAVISANAQALSGEYPDSKPAEYIRSEVERSDRLIQSLLTLARMEKGAEGARKEKFDLSRAALEVALPFESAVFEAGKRLDMAIPEGIEYTGDESMIQQLIVILLSNAQKYSDDGGKITLTLECRGDKRVLKVHNTGPAIPREAQARIFDRFYRVDSSHNREVEGNGLGLAIARTIVAAHKGKIAVHSAEGEGTLFTVTL